MKLNALSLNLREYENLAIYDRPQTVTIEGTPIFNGALDLRRQRGTLVNEEVEPVQRGCLCMGHLELAGFYANQDYKCQHGTDPNVFKNFDTVFSGHFHKKSKRNNITYLGNAYQLYWNDVDELRGFHIFDLETGELEFIPNPNTMFHKIYYNESKQTTVQSEQVQRLLHQNHCGKQIHTQASSASLVDQA